MRHWLWAVAAIMAAMIWTSNALAQTYDFSADFPGGGGISGFITYDPATNRLTSAHIETTANGASLARTYTVTSGSVFSITDIYEAGGPGPSARGVDLRFSPTLDQASPQLTNALEFVCATDCDTKGYGRQVLLNIVFTQRAAPAAVPTLSEWAMILFAAALAGGAALTISRRRRFA
jgi:hypothetical protein